MSRQHAVVESAASKETQERVWDAFRRWGYLQADLDPLGDLQPVAMPELEVNGPEADAARRFYCGTIGVEFMHNRRSRTKAMDSGAHGAPKRLMPIANESWNGWFARKFSNRFCRHVIWERNVIRSKARRRCYRCWMRS